MEQSKLILYYQNKVDQLFNEVREMNVQRFSDYQMANDFSNHAYSLIMLNLNMYRSTLMPIYVERIKDLKKDYIKYNDDSDSVINNLRLHLIDRCNEALAEMESFFNH
jgi:hypothetical protein